MAALPEVALSVRQPWAWAIIHGGKDIENRSWRAIRHGIVARRICIHASRGMTRREYDGARAFMAEIGTACPRPEALVRGAIIGTVRVAEIVGASASRWFAGPKGLVLVEPRALDPIPALGMLGYFAWQEAGALEEPKPWMMAWPSWSQSVEAQKQMAIL